MTWTAMLAMTCGVLTVVLLGAPAAAHTDLISVDPADGLRLDRAPRQLVLEFSEEMNPRLSTVTLAVDGGDPTQLELANGRSPSTLVATVPASQAAEPGDASRWRAAFRVVSTDGHPVAGETSFTVLPADNPDEQGARPTSPTPQGQEAETMEQIPETDEEDGGVPWLLVVAPAVVLGVLLLVVMAAMRLLRRDEEDQ
ncbi:copper resistance protein CopC [Nocardioidaceae bacterium]|nr:copper resistance protein CopC [Nocardioidaceae bacterium]